MPKRRQPEAELQKSVIEYLRYRLQGCLFFHVPNGGKRSAAEGAKFKAMGVLAGVADILIFKDGGFYAIELKAGVGGMSCLQKDFKERWCDECGKYAVCRSIDEVKEMLKKWQL